MIDLTIIKTTRLYIKNYTYLLCNKVNKAGILVDPAWEESKYYQALDTSKAQLSAILLTHHHMDHVDLADRLARKYSCPVYMSATEVDYYNFKCANLEPINPDTEYLDIKDIKVKIIPTPGHTYGGTCFLIADKLFSGDTLFIEGCGMCTGNGGDPYKMFESLQRLKNIINDNVQVYPGHRYTMEIGENFAYVKKHNIYLSFNKVEDFVKFRMRKGQNGLLNFT